MGMYGPNDVIGACGGRDGNNNSGCGSVILILIVIGATLFCVL